MKNILLTALIGMFAITSFAQNNWCGTTHQMDKMLEANPQMKLVFEKEMNKIISQSKTNIGTKSGNLITIPVVVHNFHDNGDGYISDAQVHDAIRVLNEDFQRLNKDTNQTRAIFKPYAANIGIQFKLAQIDPNGKGTRGIVRINTPLTTGASDNVKALSKWPSNKYLNFWVVKSIDIGSTNGTTLGYAYLPYSGISSNFGVVIRADAFGTIEASNADGRTTTHEVGHSLGLLHTFQGGCGFNCGNSGDRMCDTPPASESTHGCSSNLNQCSNDATGAGSVFTTNVVNQIENYMSYDACQNMFSKEQAAAMQDAIKNIAGLIQLTSYPNLVNTGTDSTHVITDNAPIADFFYSNKVICQNTNITYTDISYNGTIGTRTWTFPGGTPATSTDSIVTVNYSVVGSYNASLTITNPVANNTKTYNNVVEVKSNSPAYTSWFYMEGMEDSKFNNEWVVVNNGGSAKWSVTNKAAYTGDNCVFINNFSGNQLGAIDEFISPSYNLNAVLNPELFFKLAYKRRISSNSDALRVYVSTDCGNTWSIRFAKTGASLETAPTNNSPFTPDSSSEWKEFSVNFPPSIENSDNVLFKFEFEFNGGNNIYIDDIQIRNPLGIDDKSDNGDLISLYPNPANDFCKLSIKNIEGWNNVSINVTDLQGRIVIPVTNQNYLSAGTHAFDINTAELNAGIYLISTVSDNGGKVQKLVVN